jgi:hypothetical protein
MQKLLEHVIYQHHLEFKKKGSRKRASPRARARERERDRERERERECRREEGKGGSNKKIKEAEERNARRRIFY